jgi:hypothetical protein
MNRLNTTIEQKLDPEYVPHTPELGRAAIVLGLVTEVAYNGDAEVDQLPVGANTLSAYGNTYDSGNGSEG